MGISQVVIGIDGGASKTDVAAVTMDGELVGRETGPGSCPHFVGVAGSQRIVDELVAAAAGDSQVVHAGVYMSGLDLPREVETYRQRLVECAWARNGLDVDNDLFGLLRSGSENPNAVAVICGTGTNAVGVHSGGDKVRFYSLGALSGDWGGGQGLGQEALWHAARCDDGRGPHTSLVAHITEHYGMTVSELIEQIHLEDLPELVLAELAPRVFAAADDGDPVAQQLVNRQADEVVAYVRACSNKLSYVGPVDVVLGGSVLQAANPRLYLRIKKGITEFLPGAVLLTPQRPPVVGAVLLALEAAGADRAAVVRAGSAFDELGAATHIRATS